MNYRLAVGADPGETVFACEISYPPDLVTAYTNRVEFESFGVPNQGVYIAPDNFDLSKNWWVFTGNSMPTGWHEGFSLDTSSVTVQNCPLSETDVRQIRHQLGMDGTVEAPSVNAPEPAVILPPDALGMSTGWLLAYGDKNQLTSGIPINVRMLRGPGQPGYSLDGSVFTEVSAGNGLVQFPYLLKGSVCIAWRGSADQSTVRFTVPSSGDNFSLPEILARP